MAKKWIVVVLDGFGIGAMDDVAQTRPADLDANTWKRLCTHQPALYLPTLERLGLMNAAGFETDRMHFAPRANYGKGAFVHLGADTFWGHQEIMGTLPRTPLEEPFSKRIGEVQHALEKAGFSVRRHPCGAHELLVVNEAATVADNIECDPGQAINVTASLDLIPFEDVLRIGKTVRGVVKQSRVIAFGGRKTDLRRILAAAEEHGELAGVNAPASGVYDCDYHCVHMGYGVDETLQAPFRLAQVGVPTYLLGKAADVIANPDAEHSFSIVPTQEVLSTLVKCMQGESGDAFLCANVQETDLAGHKQDCDRYIEVLKAADAGLADVMAAMQPDDVLLVMADHGNDPEIGHPHHTREYVPLLLYSCGLQGRRLGLRKTHADVGATVCAFFGAPAPESGESFLPLITKTELELRTGILLDGGILSQAQTDALKAVAAHLKNEESIDISGKAGAAFVSHLAMALHRLSTGERVQPVSAAVLEELNESECRERVKLIAQWIAAQLGLPPAELDYIRMHLSTFLE